jgi:hypothetical protein
MIGTVEVDGGGVESPGETGDLEPQALPSALTSTVADMR